MVNISTAYDLFINRVGRRARENKEGVYFLGVYSTGAIGCLSFVFFCFSLLPISSVTMALPIVANLIFICSTVLGCLVFLI
jgi:hypothetical protein